MNNFFYLKQITGKKISTGRELYVFIDSTKAYDNVPVNKLWEALKKTNIFGRDDNWLVWKDHFYAFEIIFIFNILLSNCPIPYPFTEVAFLEACKIGVNGDLELFIR